MMFKEATTVGNSLMVETIYNEYLPVLVHLNKPTYYNLILDQIDEYYGRIPYYVCNGYGITGFKNSTTAKTVRGVTCHTGRSID